MSAVLKQIPQLSPHPLAERFPMMSGDQFNQLRDDIRANGLREAIWLYEGLILDGRNRYKACLELGIEIASRNFTGDSPIAFVWSMNGARRQLTKSQLAALAVSFLPDLKIEAEKRMLRGGSPLVGEGAGKAVEVAAKIFGVGRTYVEDAASVARRSPQLFQEVVDGKISVKTARNVLGGAVAYESRAIVKTDKNIPRTQRVAEITRLASLGADLPQIAQAMNTSEENASKIAHAAGIKFHSNKSTRVRARRVIVESVNSLAGVALGLKFIDLTCADFDREEISAWTQSIANSLREIHRMRKQLERLKAGVRK